MTTALWNAIETIPLSGAPRKHWQALTGSDWPAVASMLHSTGLEASSIPCFKIQPGGCSRSIVRHSAQRIRAVCAEPEALCRSELLTMEDAEALAVDRVKLALGLAHALQLTNGKLPLASQNMLYLGHHYVHAGLGFPVFLLLGGSHSFDAATLFTDVESFKGSKLVITPTTAGLGSAARAYLAKIGASATSLIEIIDLDPNGKLVPVAPVEQVFAYLRAEFGSPSSGADWLLPADATWSKVTLEFRELQEIEARYPGSKPRRLTPQDLGLWDAKSGRPKASWETLIAIPANGGFLKPMKRKQSVDAFKQNKKQLKEALGKVIRIPEDPFEYDRQTKSYRARFIVRTDALRQGREDQNQ